MDSSTTPAIGPPCQYIERMRSLLVGGFLTAAICLGGGPEPKLAWAQTFNAIEAPRVNSLPAFSDRRPDPTNGLPAFVFKTYPFFISGDSARVEVRLSIVNDILQFVQGAAHRFDAAYEVDLVAYDKNRELVAHRSWGRSLQCASFDETNSRMVLNEERTTLRLPLGSYELQLIVTDLDSRKRLRRNYTLELLPSGDGQLALSAVVLAKRMPTLAVLDSIQIDFLHTPYAGNREQSLYFEIYNASPGEEIKLDYAIQNWRGEVLEAWTARVIAESKTLRVCESLAGKVRHPGRQQLVINAVAGQREANATLDYHALPSRVDGEEEGGRSIADSSEIPFESLRFVCRNQDFNRITAATGAFRDSLIAAFWRERDPTSETAANELREEFHRRVSYASRRFAVQGIDRAGWETDRGRLYIIFGPPREHFYRLGEGGGSPYEIWYYPDLHRYFLFRDKSGSGDFQLEN